MPVSNFKNLNGKFLDPLFFLLFVQNLLFSSDTNLCHGQLDLR